MVFEAELAIEWQPAFITVGNLNSLLTADMHTLFQACGVTGRPATMVW